MKIISSGPVLAKFRKSMIGIWLAVGGSLVIFLLLESVFSLALSLKFGRRGHVDSRVAADAYAGKDWVEEYFHDLLETSVTRWSPYVYWRRSPIRGKYINVDSSGLRKTWSIPDSARAKCNGKSKEILFLGGSTMWGEGVRDDFTIPSYVSQLLNERRDGCYQAVNLGESGYVSTQEMIQLLLEIKKGRKPDFVVFYDGINDVYSAFQNHTAGIPQNERNRERQFDIFWSFNESGPLDPFNREFLTRNFKRTATYRTFMIGAMKLLGDDLRIRKEFRSLEDESMDKLADDLVTSYAGNIRLVKSLSRQLGFEALFFWQPVVLDKKMKTEYEARQKIWGDKGIDEKKLQPGIEENWKEFYGRVNARIKILAEEGKLESVVLTGVFDTVSSPVFVDFNHLDEYGNSIIARKMLDDIVSRIAHP